jgi:hypothetical protein
MTIIRPSLFAMLERFPRYKAEVRELFQEDKWFQAMCRKYCKCAEELQYWNQSAAEEAVVRRQEYTALLRDLQAEILETLTEY